MSNISILTTIIGLAVAGLIIVLIRKDRLHASHGMTWITVAVAFSLLGFAPGFMDRIAHHLGVSYAPVLALTLAIVFLVIKILLMDIEFSHTEIRTQRLIQRVAMLEADMAKMRTESVSNPISEHGALDR